MSEHSENTPKTLLPILLTTRQAEAYVGKSAVLDFLREKHGLRPMFTNIGLGGRASLWHRPTIDQHLHRLATTQDTIQIQPCQENDANSNSTSQKNSKPNASRRTA